MDFHSYLHSIKEPDAYDNFLTHSRQPNSKGPAPLTLYSATGCFKALTYHASRQQKLWSWDAAQKSRGRVRVTSRRGGRQTRFSLESQRGLEMSWRTQRERSVLDGAHFSNSRSTVCLVIACCRSTKGQCSKRQGPRRCLLSQQRCAIHALIIPPLTCII
jgi:hypothetical protein